jgi:hypothetical protein
MCIPDACNPLKILEFGCSILCIVILVFVGGYVGKGIYVQHNNPDESTYHMIRDPSFYTPDFTFWALGIVFVILLFALLAILQWILSKMWKHTKRFFIWALCFPCSGDDPNYVSLSLDTKV